MQELRHAADYDPLRRFNRADMIIEVGRAEGLVNDWGLVPDGDEKRFFLYLMPNHATVKHTVRCC